MLRTLSILFAVAAALVGPATAQDSAPQPARAAREIRPPPAVPPDKAAKPLASVPLVNAGFESTVPGKVGSPEGWWVVQHAGPVSYTFEPDTTIRRSGDRSLRVTNVGPEPFGAVYQTVPAAAYRGRTLRFSAWLRTEGTTGNRFASGAGLKLHSVKGGYPLDIAEMRRDAVHGTTDWARYEITLKVRAEAEGIEAGLVLFGPGRAWIDDTALDVVADAAPVSEPPSKGPAK
ncbi:MAG: hypothetical protein OEX23_01220 [Betaproteobacteria bacterium]|nr:hypothetical protein [Betaproteobacteria bacterium]